MSGALLAACASPIFARHETFHPRYGWLRKAFTETSSDPAVFHAPNATVRLGVGKNMVHAIRYWSQAYKVLQETPNPDRPRLPLLKGTDFGQMLLSDDDGFDPYLEDAGTLWLLHWKLFSPPCLAPAWWVTFNAFPLHYFSESQLISRIIELASAAGWPPVVEASIKKDVECVLRMYASRVQGRDTLDDLLDCPFRELRLIEPVPGETRIWRFTAADSSGPPPLIVAYSCLDFLARIDGAASSISVTRLATDAGSPGCVYRLSEAGIIAALSAAARILPALRLIDSIGRGQLMLERPAEVLAQHALMRHYCRDVAAGAA